MKIISNFNNNGNLHYGEALIKGKSKKEIFISTYICHPSMANNELSGPLVSTAIYNYFKNKKKINIQLDLFFYQKPLDQFVI